MKTLNSYITEKFQVSKDHIRGYKYYPETSRELIECIRDKIEKEGLGTKDKPLDLNDIDTSEITNMKNLFNRNNILYGLSVNGYFDISDWDVSNVEDMSYIFLGSSFDGDISGWDVSKVKNMQGMFEESKFTGKNGDIGKWKVNNVENMHTMFCKSWFEGKISKWNVGNVINMYAMFFDCYNFNDDINNWHTDKVKNMSYMFFNTALDKNKNLPEWYHE